MFIPIKPVSNVNLDEFINSNLYKEDSKFKGVCKNSKNDLWRSYVYKNGKQITLGSSFISEEEAYIATLQR